MNNTIDKNDVNIKYLLNIMMPKDICNICISLLGKTEIDNFQDQLCKYAASNRWMDGLMF